MGNSQSAPEKRDGKRLSKQSKKKTIPSSPYNQGPTSPLPKQSPFPGPQSEVHDTTSPQRPRIDQVQQISSEANHPTGSYLSISPVPDNEDEVTELRSSTREPLNKMKSPRSSSTNLIPTSRSNLVTDPRTIDLNTAVGILEELRKTASPEDLVALRKLAPLRYID
jgi:hypothetical protein